jgi:GTPase Era involved in 16S rRNA processing
MNNALTNHHTQQNHQNIQQTSTTVRPDRDNKKEFAIIRSCKHAHNNLFQLQDLIQAGELQYNNQTLDDITQRLVQNLNYRNYTFPKFLLDCLIPIMYLLKRQQNLDDFFISLTFKYQEIEQFIERTNLSLRMLLHILFLNSNIFLQRIIMSLLCKRNPVPFIFPNIHASNEDKSYEFMPGIIHVWNSTRPTILSFGIGPCKGKSTLLNQLFQSTFEQTVDSIYFQQTIDIDFGYCFNPERTLNIADTHGLIDRNLLEEIYSLFDGYLIQIDKIYLDQQPEILIEYLKILPKNKFQMIIIRDTPMQNIQECSDMIRHFLDRTRVNFSQKLCIYPLVNISNTNDRNIIFAIKKIRDDLLTKIQSEVRITNNKDQIVSNLHRLIKGNYMEHLERLNRTIQPLKIYLLQKTQHESFPLYFKFQELCKLRQTLKKLDFYCSESENMFEIYEKLNKLEGELNPNTKTFSSIQTGRIFDLFIDILKSDNMLMSLDLLSTELKSELLALGADKIANDLTIENSFLSLEVLWRNAIVCYNHTTNNTQNLLAKSYCEFIEAGFPFEIIDGDNLNFQHPFLSEVLKNFDSQRILVISIIGPQNSGKSTLLNYMFGTLFDVREGRCTRGIYGSFVKLVKSNRNSKIPDVDYIMLIDTEGLLSIEKSDNEYDRRLVLFCLAVSHLVIVNMMGDVNETLKDMLTLCADSLKQIGVNKVNQPIVHFVLNQKADPNLKNHSEAIEKIIRDFKEKDLAEVIDISSKTFHTLPSAFKKERVSNDVHSSCFLRTEPDFIQCTQQLCEKIIESAKSSYGRSDQTFSDPPQWLRTAVTVFDTLQKFPDLTYFKDINERRQDDRIRQHIGELISKTLPADYRKRTIVDLCELTESDIRKQIQAKFDVHQNDLDNELKIIFKATNASERIRERSKQFLKRQITEISNAWCTAALQAHDQKQMEVLVRDGSDDLRKLIDDLIKSGQTMTKEKATEEFEIMWNRKLESINRNFDPQERLKQAVKFVYGNYNIFEKQCLPSHEHILEQLPIITKLSEKSDMTLVIAAVQAQFAHTTYRQRQSALENNWSPSNTNITYTLATIENFTHLNKFLLKDLYVADTVHQDAYFVPTLNYDERNKQSSKKQGARHSSSNIMRKGLHAMTNFLGFGPLPTTTDQQITVVNPLPLQFDFIQHVNYMIHKEMENTPNGKSNILCVTILFNRIVQETVAIIVGNSAIRRPIEIDLIQKIVGLINTIINEINLELVVFKLALSKQTKSSIHTFILILLTMYYYDEQKNHFHQQILTLNKEKQSLLTYFISMVVPDAQCDNEGAELFANKVKSAVESNLVRDAQMIITRIIDTQQNLNRKQIQIICDGKLHAAADDDDWLFRYIDAPTDIIIEEFQILWKEVEKAINQQLEQEKNQWKNILIEFFNRIEYILSSLANEGSAAQFVDDIFSASGGIAADNLINKGQCMVLLLYAYLSADKIQPGTSYTVFNENYTLKTKGLQLFEKLPTPTQRLANLINGMKDTDNSNHNRTTIASIKNLHFFLQSILDVKNMILETYDNIPATFETFDNGQNYNKLLDKVRGCTSKCPCCQRPCDVDHTLIKSNAGIIM